jgi:putative FmdB family regulatory protein
MLTLSSVPTYEYECPKCPRVFEVKQRISEPAFTTCDRCGGPIHRLLNATPFILKGGGWYVTDYPSESRKKALSSESGGNSSSSSESKPSTGEGSSSSGSPSSGDSGASGEAAKSTPKPSAPAKSSGTE